ncbi:uncharacterized protein LOC109862754 [Pseudomyrmex gracilis]|uniref:uncharacterized protein LOC109862754 n=1 Tax=Pseudomyrmex gracilis TaxID=219809 RepID=UPI000994B409|nr:uncharacterized protein LOC109862754 [Pseudomyrmex gracilis]
MALLGIQMTQINLHHSKSASAILARSMAMMQTSIALIQEPWFVNGAIRGLSGCGNLYKTHSEKRIRSCILVKGLNAIFLPQLSSEDLTVIRVRVQLAEKEDMEILIGSAYMPFDSRDPPPQEEVKTLVAYAEDRGLELLLGCDANPHHVGWESTDINPRGESLHGFLMGTGLTILNRGTEPTFQDSRRRKVIDITVSTEKVAGLVRDWRVSNEPSGSDHRQIRLTLQHSPPISWACNPRKTNWNGFRAYLKARLAGAPTSYRSKNNLEDAADYLKNAIVDAYESNCLSRPRKPMTKIHWWNNELEKLRSETRKGFNKAKRTGLAAYWEAFRSFQREYSKAITKAKCKSWRHFCKGIESTPEASRLCRILSLDHRPQLGCLKLPTGNITEKGLDTLKHLIDVHFPGFDN